jgi:hypothetical protein
MLLIRKYVPLQYASSSTWFQVIWVFSKSWNFVKGGVLAFLWNSIFQISPKYILSYYNVLIIIIYNISVSGVVKISTFKDSFIFKKFWKKVFFWKNLTFTVLAVLRMLLMNTYVWLQYAFYMVSNNLKIFEKSEILSRGGIGILVKTRFFKNVPKNYS